MEALVAVLSAASVQGAIALCVVALGVGLLRLPKRLTTRNKVTWVVLASAFALLGAWTMHQQSNVLAGSPVHSADKPVAIATRGVVRYVSETQAHRYHGAMWAIVVLVVVSTGIHKVSSRTDEA